MNKIIMDEINARLESIEAKISGLAFVNMGLEKLSATVSKLRRDKRFITTGALYVLTIEELIEIHHIKIRLKRLEESCDHEIETILKLTRQHLHGEEK
jgi:hypothetical protein